MGGIGVFRLLAATLLAGISVNWIQFKSEVYPYSIRQPSSFRHVVLTNTAHVKIDYFSPALGSATTDVSIFAERGTQPPDTTEYLRDLNGTHIRKSGTAAIAGHRCILMAANFSSFGNKWTVEQAVFVDNGTVWWLSMSYDYKFKNLRPTMLTMLKSFKIRSGTRT